MMANKDSIIKCGPDPLAERFRCREVLRGANLFDTKKFSPFQEYFLKITYKQTNWSWKMSMCTFDSLESLKDFYNWTPALMPFRVLSSPRIKFLGQKTTPKKKVQAESLRHKSKLLVILLLYLHKSHSPSTSKQIFAEFVNGVLGGMVFCRSKYLHLSPQFWVGGKDVQGSSHSENSWIIPNWFHGCHKEPLLFFENPFRWSKFLWLWIRLIHPTLTLVAQQFSKPPVFFLGWEPSSQF